MVRRWQKIDCTLGNVAFKYYGISRVVGKEHWEAYPDTSDYPDSVVRGVLDGLPSSERGRQGRSPLRHYFDLVRTAGYLTVR